MPVAADSGRLHRPMNTPDLVPLAVEAMQSRGLLPTFPAKVMVEADAARHATPERGGDIRDLRQLPWLSIDNDDTRDLDQLSVVEPLPDGSTRLRVAVADVDTLVPLGGAIDKHAAVNTTSVYTAAGVFPMLPMVLSTDLTSLHEGKERLAVVVDMVVAANGDVGTCELYRAVVVNQAKLTYGDVSAWLDGKRPLRGRAGLPGLEDQLLVHDAVAAALRRQRAEHGALEVDTVSARPVFEDGVLVDLEADGKLRAKNLIADLMIATNTATARFLVGKGFPSVRRFLESPRRWDRIEALAAGYGAVLPTEPDALALHAFLGQRRQADPEGFADLSLRIVKMLGAGAYVAARPNGKALGHFGLAVSNYAHSTAPNRRYPDLVTQRLVKAALAGKPPPYTFESLQDIARHCTLQEDNANRVERQVLKAAGALLLRGRIGDTFDAIVTGAAPKGTFVRISGPLLEGRLVRGFEGTDVGDALRVRLVALDREQGHIDFERA
jgi:exoribonuclease-2